MTDTNAFTLAVLHIAKEALSTAAVRHLDTPHEFRGEGDYARFMGANEHIEKAIARLVDEQNAPSDPCRDAAPDLLARTLEHRPMTTKHTPGPWTVASTPESTLCVYNVGCHLQFPVAFIGFKAGAEAANARLIAAAPDMLAALRRVAFLLDGCKGGKFLCLTPDSDYGPGTETAVRDAIAKATGDA